MIRVKMDGKDLELSPTKMVCLLRSYAAHARELENEVPERPIFFLKPPSSLVGNGGTVIIPEGSKEVHHEVELAVIMGKRIKDLGPEEIPGNILGYTVMLDITARDLQTAARSKGLPWSESKGFDTFAPIGPKVISAEGIDWRGRRIWLDVNGQRKQDSNTDMLLWSIERIISDISRVMTLEEGDIIMTGTPEGVGPLRSGDRVTAGIDGIEPLEVVVR